MTAHRPTAGSSAAAHSMRCLPTTLDELVHAVQARLGLACELRCDAEAILQRVRDFSNRIDVQNVAVPGRPQRYTE